MKKHELMAGLSRLFGRTTPDTFTNAKGISIEGEAPAPDVICLTLDSHVTYLVAVDGCFETATEDEAEKFAAEFAQAPTAKRLPK